MIARVSFCVIIPSNASQAPKIRQYIITYTPITALSSARRTFNGLNVPHNHNLLEYVRTYTNTTTNETRWNAPVSWLESAHNKVSERREKRWKKKQAYLEWNHSDRISKHPSGRFLSRLSSSRRSNFQQGNIHTRLPAFDTREITRCRTIFVSRQLALLDDDNTLFFISFRNSFACVATCVSPCPWRNEAAGRRTNDHEAFFLRAAIVTHPLTPAARDTASGWGTAVDAGSTLTEATFLRPILLAMAIRACVLLLRHFSRSSVL